MVNDQDNLISVKDAAKECGKNPETVRRWIWSGKLPAEKLGNQLFVRRKELERFLRGTSGSGETESEAEAVATDDNLAIHPSVADTGPDLSAAGEEAAIDDGYSGLQPTAKITRGARADIISRLQMLRQRIRDRAGNLDVENDIDQNRKERMG